jgi:hypothetical protein
MLDTELNLGALRLQAKRKSRILDKPNRTRHSKQSLNGLREAESFSQAKVNPKNIVCRILNRFRRPCESADILKEPYVVVLKFRQMAFMLRFRQVNALLIGVNVVDQECAKRF